VPSVLQVGSKWTGILGNDSFVVQVCHSPVLCAQEVLNGAGSEIQLAAAASFLTILQDDIILIHTHTFSILKTVLLHLNHRDTGSCCLVPKTC